MLLSMLLDDLEDDAVSALYQVGREACGRARRAGAGRGEGRTGARAARRAAAAAGAGRRRPRRPRQPPAPLRPWASRQVGPYVITIKQRPGEGRVLDKELEEEQEQVGAAGGRAGGRRAG
jgi:hypothetical protein